MTELEAKLTALKNEARRGACPRGGAGADSAELAEIEAMLRAATNDVSRIEEQMGVPGGAQLQGHELDALRETLLARLALESGGDGGMARAALEKRKEEEMRGRSSSCPR